MRKVFLDKFSSYSLFFHISHCSIYLLCLGMICWLDLCFIELSSNMFIIFWFVHITFHFLFLISCFVGENSVICISGLFIWSWLLWQAFLTNHWTFQVSRKQEKFIKKYFLSKFTSYSIYSTISQFSLSLLCVGIFCWFVFFFVRICVLFVVCDFFDYGWEVVDFLFVAFFHGMLVSFSRLFI